MSMKYIIPDGSEFSINNGLTGNNSIISDFMIAPETRNLPSIVHGLWATTQGGVARSLNGGGIWETFSKGDLGEPLNTAGDSPAPNSFELVQSSVHVISINAAIVLRAKETDPKRIWLYKTIDGGQTWANIQLDVDCNEASAPTPSTWSLVSTAPFIRRDQVSAFGGNFYILSDEAVWEWDGVSYTEILEDTERIRTIVAFNNDLYFTSVLDNPTAVRKWTGVLNGSVIVQSAFGPGFSPNYLEVDADSIVCSVLGGAGLSKTKYSTDGTTWLDTSWDAGDVTRSGVGSGSQDRSQRKILHSFYHDGLAAPSVYTFSGTVWVQGGSDNQAPTDFVFTTEANDKSWYLEQDLPSEWSIDTVNLNLPTAPADVSTIITLSDYGFTFGRTADFVLDMTIYLYSELFDSWSALDASFSQIIDASKDTFMWNQGGKTYLSTMNDATNFMEIYERAETIPTV